ncbi:MAG: hypothetical protein E5V16_22030 [Mesorhizobium sp.]|nr:MAG: hypothetical protein E5V16_22030 [Mesorhizobium sp.]
MEIVLWDLRGKVVGEPLYKLLGRAVRGRSRLPSTSVSELDAKCRSKHLVQANFRGSLARDV